VTYLLSDLGVSMFLGALVWALLLCVILTFLKGH
jgi:hypothetical protein